MLGVQLSKTWLGTAKKGSAFGSIASGQIMEEKLLQKMSLSALEVTLVLHADGGGGTIPKEEYSSLELNIY